MENKECLEKIFEVQEDGHSIQDMLLAVEILIDNYKDVIGMEDNLENAKFNLRQAIDEINKAEKNMDKE